MAIANRSAGNQGNEITADEFKRWLKKFDTDGDGQISVQELRAAIRASGGWWFCTRKAKRGVKIADKNLNGAIDDYEIDHLVDFAQKYLARPRPADSSSRSTRIPVDSSTRVRLVSF